MTLAMKLLRCLWTISVWVLVGIGAQDVAQAEPEASVLLRKAPQGGIAPQAVVDAQGTIHLVYFKGDSKAGDIFYAWSKDEGATWSLPIRVNSQAGSAIAIGTIRGAQIALGKNNRVHISWNGSALAKTRTRTTGENDTPLLYTRLTDSGEAFEPQRNLITWAAGLDGGGTIAAGSDGTVYVLWHAGDEEAKGSVYLTKSTDDGKTFLPRERKVDPEPKGACACCQMRALLTASGKLYVLYRAAGNNENRDSMLLASSDGGETFTVALLQKWKLNACPMSSFALADGGSKSSNTQASWETQDQIFRLNVNEQAGPVPTPIAAPGTAKARKHPTLAINKRGETLWAWTEGTGWSRGGSLAYQTIDARGQASPVITKADSIPMWSLPTAVAMPDGNFVLIY